jgi:hypothetical protein
MTGSIVETGEPTTAVERQARYVDNFEGKSRVFVLTDIGNEPDDQMSLTRFLLYSNDFDIEGLVAVTSTCQREKLSPEIIRQVLSNYGKIRPNLLKHCDGFLPLRTWRKWSKAVNLDTGWQPSAKEGSSRRVRNC